MLCLNLLRPAMLRSTVPPSSSALSFASSLSLTSPLPFTSSLSAATALPFSSASLPPLRFHCTKPTRTMPATVYAADLARFNTSHQLPFVRTHRIFSPNSPANTYVVDRNSPALTSGPFPALIATLRSSAPDCPALRLTLSAYACGALRLVIDDAVPPPRPRHAVSDVLCSSPPPQPAALSGLVAHDASGVSVRLPGDAGIARLSFSPFRLDLLPALDATPTVCVNACDRLRVDPITLPPQSPLPPVPPPGGDDVVEAPHGPESVGLDIAFPFASALHGLPERTTAFSLPDTVRADAPALSEPFRLYNLDVSFYEPDSPLGLYGCVPLVVARDARQAAAVFWHNTSETYVDASTPAQLGRHTHWYSESGVLDAFLLPGPSVSRVYAQYCALTGNPVMQPRFALGYHQCRYSYMSEEDARGVDAGLDERDMPYDVLWLDIDHTRGKRYFTWDESRFPDPPALQRLLASKGRKLVTIIDPHIKCDPQYSLHARARKEGLFVRNADGSDFVGECWPGQSSYFDYTNPRARQVWGSQFLPENYPHFARVQHVWNDMNEPSVFDGPENTFPKHLLHFNDVEHRHVHNVYGHDMIRATWDGVRAAHGGDSRPFVLTRSFFAGSQRYAAVWTGDNTADWTHLALSVPMLLALQVCGVTMSGADVGGFFGDPDGELAVRWYQAAAMQPFFRGHSNTDTQRREPWVFGQPFTNLIAETLRMRYEFIPLWYTLMAAGARGAEAGFGEDDVAPMMRPLWWQFADAPDGACERQWMVGDALLVAPVLTAGVTRHTVYLPHGEAWYDALRAPHRRALVAEKDGAWETDVDLGSMIVLQRGGTVVPKYARGARSTASGAGQDGLVVVAALDACGRANGKMYLDDGDSFAFEQGVFALFEIVVRDGRVSARTLGGDWKAVRERSDATIAKIVVLGVRGVSEVRVDDAVVPYSFREEMLTVEGLRLPLGGQWHMDFESDTIAPRNEGERTRANR